MAHPETVVKPLGQDAMVSREGGNASSVKAVANDAVATHLSLLDSLAKLTDQATVPHCPADIDTVTCLNEVPSADFDSFLLKQIAAGEAGLDPRSQLGGDASAAHDCSSPRDLLARWDREIEQSICLQLPQRKSILIECFCRQHLTVRNCTRMT